jgi:hypothetical protein
MWQRFDRHMAQVDRALSHADNQVPQALLDVLDALNDLWEHWHRTKGLNKLPQQDDYVRGDVDGETTAALVHARGGKTHGSVIFGRLSDAYGDVYRDYYGSWVWQDYQNPVYPQRNAWLKKHLENKLVLPPLKAAERWFHGQPGLQ